MWEPTRGRAMLNPITYTEKVVGDFLRYQLTTYPFADASLNAQMRRLLSLEATRNTPLMRGPYISLSRSFRQGAAIKDLDGQLPDREAMRRHFSRLGRILLGKEQAMTLRDNSQWFDE